MITAAQAGALTLAWVGFNLPPQEAWAQTIDPAHAASQRLSVYRDDDANLVITHLTEAESAVGAHGRLSGSFLVDVISSASVDLVASATEHYDEKRISTTLDGAWTFGEVEARAGYGYTHEDDFIGHGLSAGFSREFNAKNNVAALDYSLLLAKIGRRSDPTFSESATTHGVEASISQVLTSRLTSTLGYGLNITQGYQAKPYRYAHVGNVIAEALCVSCEPERLPHLRRRHAVWTSGRYYLGWATAVEWTYRYYWENWGITAHTPELRLYHELGEAWDVSARYRLTRQSKASFYGDVYDERHRYASGDRELGALTGHLLGGTVGYRLKLHRADTSLLWEGKFDWFHYDYQDFAALPQRNGTVVETAVGVEF